MKIIPIEKQMIEKLKEFANSFDDENKNNDARIDLLGMIDVFFTKKVSFKNVLKSCPSEIHDEIDFIINRKASFYEKDNKHYCLMFMPLILLNDEQEILEFPTYLPNNFSAALKKVFKGEVYTSKYMLSLEELESLSPNDRHQLLIDIKEKKQSITGDGMINIDDQKCNSFVIPMVLRTPEEALFEDFSVKMNHDYMHEFTEYLGDSLSINGSEIYYDIQLSEPELFEDVLNNIQVMESQMTLYSQTGRMLDKLNDEDLTMFYQINLNWVSEQTNRDRDPDIRVSLSLRNHKTDQLVESYTQSIFTGNEYWGDIMSEMLETAHNQGVSNINIHNEYVKTMMAQGSGLMQ